MMGEAEAFALALNIFAMPKRLKASVREQGDEAPVEKATPWFGRSLTLPANELAGSR